MEPPERKKFRSGEVIDDDEAEFEDYYDNAGDADDTDVADNSNDADD